MATDKYPIEVPAERLPRKGRPKLPGKRETSTERSRRWRKGQQKRKQEKEKT